MQRNYTYAAFGETERQAGTTENSYLFAGEHFDRELGNYYLRQRYYDSSSGRFVSRDEYEGNVLEPITLNKYLYANASPTNYIDPSGNFSISEQVTISVIIGILAQILFPDPVQTPGFGEQFAGSNPYRGPFEIVAGVLTGALLTRLVSTALSRASVVTVYRVEGAVNTRVLISEAGEVILEGEKTLFLNFGQRARAIEFFDKRINQGMADTQIKSFQVSKAYLDEVRSTAVPERLARLHPDSPIQVDVTKAPDQYGLRRDQIEQLRTLIIKGSGKVQK
jgi:RHS repeat-associated protein